LNPRKQEKLSGAVQRYISDILGREVSDPRLCGATVNRVLLSGDGSGARVFYSMVGSLEEQQSCREAMESAAPFIRRRLASMLETRTVPVLQFIFDSSIRQGEEVLSVIRKMERDAVPD
jgi:ribosome-binding factor A